MGIQERRNREKERRKKQIIETAGKEFIKSGLRHTSIKEIAQKAELSPRTIYTYFSNKQALYGAVLLSGLKILSEEMGKIASKEPDPVKAIEMVKNAYGNFYNNHRDYFRIMMFLGFHDIHGEVSQKLCEEISNAVLHCITVASGIIETGKRKGLFPEGDPWKLSWLLWSLFVGIGHLNEARRSLNIGKQNFERLFDFAYKSLMFKETQEAVGKP